MNSSETLKPIPDSWRLVALGDRKNPYQHDWQRRPLNKEQIATEFASGKAKTVGIILGGDLMAVDHDGDSCDRVIEALSLMPVSEALPKSVSFTSGRTGRFQVLYRVPDEFQNRIRSKAISTGEIDNDGKSEQLDFRYSGCQSAIAGHHPITGSYRWLNSPDLVPVADCPQWILDYLAALPSEYESNAAQYQWAKFKNAVPDGDVTGLLTSALEAVDPDCCYHTWLALGMALSAMADEQGFTLWDEWSRRGKKYEPGCTVKRWDTFSGCKSSPWDVLAIAKRYGWLLPKPVVVSKDDDSIERFETSYEYTDALLCDELRIPLEKLSAAFNQPPIIATAALLTIAASCLKVGIVLNIGGASDWQASPILWTGIIADSGAAKSPIVKQLMKGIKELQADDDAVHEAKEAEYRQDLKAYESAFRSRRTGQSTDGEELPDEPVKPNPIEHFVKDFTIESLAGIISKQPNKGLLVANDELRQFFDSMGAYKSKGGGDRAQWLGFRDGAEIKRNRKGSKNEGSERVSVSRTSISVLGTIQPQILTNIITGDKDGADGLYPRFLWIRMPSDRMAPSIGGVSWDATARFKNVYASLNQIESQAYQPTREALELFNKWHLECEYAKTQNHDDIIKSVIMKYKGMALNIALILHCLNSVASGVTPSETVPLETMRRAISLSRWAIEQVKALMAINGITTDKESAKVYRFIENCQSIGWIDTEIARSKMPCEKNKNGVRTKPARKLVREFMRSLVTMGAAIDNGEPVSKASYKIQILQGSDSHPLESVSKSPKSPENYTPQVFDGRTHLESELSPQESKKGQTRVQIEVTEPLNSKTDSNGLMPDSKGVRSETFAQQAFSNFSDSRTHFLESYENGLDKNSNSVDCDLEVDEPVAVLVNGCSNDDLEAIAISEFLGDLSNVN